MNKAEKPGYIEAELAESNTDAMMSEDRDVSFGSEASEYTSSAELNVELPGGCKAITTTLFDANGRVIETREIPNAKRFVTLSKEKMSEWRNVARIVTKDKNGAVIRDMTVKHRPVPGVPGQSVMCCYSRPRYKRRPVLYFKKLNKRAVLPTRATSGSAGSDLYCPDEYVVPARGTALIMTGLSVRVPKGTCARVAPRSGLAVKHSINVGAGVIDQDCRGEIGVLLFNHSDEDFRIPAGTRIAQLIVEKISILENTEVKELDTTSRGEKGFGSTDGSGSDNSSPAAAAADSDASTAASFVHMPLRLEPFQHRQKDATVFFYSACVARSVARKEARSTPAAWDALTAEWNKLRDKNTWDESTVCEWRVIASKARRTGKKIHVGRIFDMCGKEFRIARWRS